MIGVVIAIVLYIALLFAIGYGSYNLTGYLGWFWWRGAKDRRFIWWDAVQGAKKIAIWAAPIMIVLVAIDALSNGLSGMSAPRVIGVVTLAALVSALPIVLYVVGRLCGMIWRGCTSLVLLATGREPD